MTATARCVSCGNAAAPSIWWRRSLPIWDRRWVYGEVRAGGPLVFVRSVSLPGSDKLDLLHLLMVVAAHPIESIGNIYIENSFVPLDSDGKATKAPYLADKICYAQFWKHLGSPDQAADAALIAAFPGVWRGEHRLRGRAYLHALLRYDYKVFPAGVPNLSAMVRGRRLYDPRTGSTGWSANAALCILDYVTDPAGLGAALSEVDLSSFIVAANICDEPVATPDGTSEPRYCCNGCVDLSRSSQDILTDLLTSCAGNLTWTAGKWRLYAGAWLAPSISFGEDQVRAAVTVSPWLSARNLVNSVRGTYIAPQANWVPTDYPPVTVPRYLAADDGREVAKNLDLPFTTSPYAAQRIARIALETNRRQLTVQFPANLAGLKVAAGQTILLTLLRFGLVNRPMRVATWALSEDIGVDLALTEDSPDIYTMPLADLIKVEPAPDGATGGNAGIPPQTPTNLKIVSVSVVVSLSWDAAPDSDFSHFAVYGAASNTSHPADDGQLLGEPFAGPVQVNTPASTALLLE